MPTTSPTMTTTESSVSNGTSTDNGEAASKSSLNQSISCRSSSSTSVLESALDSGHGQEHEPTNNKDSHKGENEAQIIEPSLPIKRKKEVTSDCDNSTTAAAYNNVDGEKNDNCNTSTTDESVHEKLAKKLKVKTSTNSTTTPTTSPATAANTNDATSVPSTAASIDATNNTTTMATTTSSPSKRSHICDQIVLLNHCHTTPNGGKNLKLEDSVTPSKGVVHPLKRQKSPASTTTTKQQARRNIMAGSAIQSKTTVTTVQNNQNQNNQSKPFQEKIHPDHADVIINGSDSRDNGKQWKQEWYRSNYHKLCRLVEVCHRDLEIATADSIAPPLSKCASKRKKTKLHPAAAKAAAATAATATATAAATAQDLQQLHQSQHQRNRRRSSRVASFPQEKMHNVLRTHSPSIASALLCLEKRDVMNDGKSWNDDPLEMEEQGGSDKYVTLVKQAKGLLRQWRTTLKKHDFVSCSNVVVTSARESHEKEHGENESIKLYETQVLELACRGDCTDYSLVTGRNGSNDVLLPQGTQLAKVEVEGRTVVPLRDCISGNVVPYTLRPGEYAVLVHYKDRPVDFDRWVILPYNDEEDSGVLNYWDGGNDDLAEVRAGKESVEETNGVSHKGGAYYKDGYIITDNGKFDVGLVLPLDSHVASVSALENYIQTKKSIPKEEKSVLPIAVDKPAVKRQSNGQTKDKKRKSLAKAEMVPSKKPSKLKQGVSRVETESKNQTQKSIETDAVPPKEHILSKSTSISIENSVEGSAVDDLSAPVQRKTKGSSKKLKNVKKNKSEPLKTQKESKPGPPEDNADSVKDASNEKPTQSTTKDTKLGTTQVSTTDKQSAPPPASPKKKSDRKKKDKEESQLEFTWICTECREAECFTDPSSPLLLCDGKCNRPFHYPCADLLSMPPENEPWLCTDCKQQRHQCAVCKLYGEDDVDVFCCESKTCGLFFHEACLAMYNVDIQVLEEVVAVKSDDASEDQTDKELDDVGLEDLTNIEGHAIEKCADEDASIVLTIPEASTNESNSVHNVEASSTKKKDSEYLTKIISRPKFRCPAHDCWTCCDDIPPPEMGESDAPEEAKKGKRGKKRKPAHGTFLSMYGAKKERLFRCLDCPIAYHITCIPPASRFHELALLCHEHSYTSKLPYLDSETSFQAEVEADADEKIKKLKKQIEKKFATQAITLLDSSDDHGAKENAFLPGIVGSFTTFEEDQLAAFLREEQSGGGRRKPNQFQYCLPCDFKEEVHSKPPAYTHINTNRYDPRNRPKRHPPTNESCQCTQSADNSVLSCGDRCLNRLSYVECVGDKTLKSGDKNPYWNCNCGPNCGNRGVSKRQFAKCRPMREQGRGWGLITVNGVKRGDLVQEYCGEIIDEKTKETRLAEWTLDHPNDPNFYVMHLEPGWYIDAREVANLARFINHSCDPNCKLVPVNAAGHTRVAIICIRDVAPGEFLCYDYQFDTQHGEKFICRCGAAKCRGTMKGGKSDTKPQKKTKKQLLSEAKARVQRDKKFLQSFHDSEKDRLHLTGLLVPGERKDGPEFVAGGPREKYRQDAQHGRIFLWRNAQLGADFSSRYWKQHCGYQTKSKKSDNLASVRLELGIVDVISILKQHKSSETP